MHRRTSLAIREEVLAVTHFVSVGTRHQFFRFVAIAIHDISANAQQLGRASKAQPAIQLQQQADGAADLLPDRDGSWTPAWSTQDANRASACDAELAWIVDSVPACPVFNA